MPQLLPILNGGNNQLIETLQQGSEMQESQIDIAESYYEGIFEILSNIEALLESLVQPMYDLVDLLKEEVSMDERHRIREDIEDERTDVADLSDSIGDSGELFDFDNIDTSMFGNILGMAVLSYLYDVDKFIRGAAAAFIAKLHKAPLLLFKIPDLIIDGFRSMVAAVKGIEFLKIGALITVLQNKFVAIKNALLSPFARLFGFIDKFVGKPVRALAEMLRGVGRSISSLMRPLGAALKIVGKLLGPFTLIVFGIIDFVKGFVEGFSEGGALEGLKMGLKEVINGMIAVPLDLLKAGLAWVAGKFGWENVQKSLEGFSFSNILDRTFSNIGAMFDWEKMKEKLGSFSFSGILNSTFSKIGAIFDWENIKEVIGEFSLKDKIKETFQNLIKFFEDLVANPMATVKKLIFGESDETDTDTDTEPRVKIERSLTHREQIIRDQQVQRNPGLNETGVAVGTGSERTGSRRDPAKSSKGGGLIVSQPTATDNSQTTVNNLNYLGPGPSVRSNDHTYKELQKSYAQ